MTAIVKRLVLISTAVLIGVAANGHAQPCITHLVSHGPIDPENGFPQYYIDANDLAAGQCLDVACNPGFVTPDPTRPVSFPDNFPVEFFYMRVVSRFDGPPPFSARYTAALEGSFANGLVVLPGDQVVFTRIRIRIAPLIPFAEYTITHPYGVNVLAADELGAIDFTENVGNNVPLDFEISMTAGNVGPFLTPLPDAIPPAPGVLDPTQSLTGSPCDTNFFMIEGPGLPGDVPALFTDQFVLITRKARTCGNGVPDPFEQCDDGNTQAGDCCSPTCQLDTVDTPCATNECLDGMTCDAAGKCGGGVPKPGPCDDHNACTADDACSEGVCVGGPQVHCDDGNPCTTDSCDPARGCVFTPNTLSCDDGDDVCTSGDTCTGGVCVGTPLNCDDGNPCTTDSCDRAQGCVHTPNNARCEDGDACTIADTCAGGSCVGGPPRPCDDGNVCTTDSCDPSHGCVYTPNSLPCDDGNACTVGDGCAGGACVGAPLDCDDGNPCTTDSCDPAAGCVHTPNTAPCDDGNACTIADTCAGGICVGGGALSCDDGNVCTTDSCDPLQGCVYGFNKLPCDDGNACTLGDTCRNGACVGVRCTAGNATAKVLADTTVDASAPTKNFGSATQLHVDAGPSVPGARGGLRRAFLRVQVSGVGSNRRVGAAHLRLKAATTTNANSVTGGRIHQISSCGWNERIMTFGTQPPIDGPVLSEVGGVGLGQVADFDVTSAITGDGTYCFAIESPSTDGVDYVSREAKSGRPVLTVSAVCACGAGF